MDPRVAFVLTLAAVIFEAGHVCSQSTSPPMIYASQNPIPVGSNVTLFSTTTVTRGIWLFKTDLIVMILSGDSITTNAWINRTIFNTTTSSLSITSLTVQDSGLYTLNAINLFHVELTLSVQAPITNVTMWAKATDLVEFNDTAVFMCSAAGSFPSFVWMNGSSVVTAGGQVQMSSDNSTLTIVNATRYDQGPFSCNVSNGVSYQVSLPVYLNISYGPSNTTMKIEPQSSASMYLYKTGSNITLSCSAQSKPSVMIMWMVNDTYLNQSGSELRLQNVTENNSANYKCLLYNPVTHRFSSASAMIWIMDPVTAVVVSGTNTPPIVNMTFTLNCEVTRNVGSILWMKNGHLISAGNNTFINNNTLMFNPVQLSDNGMYECQAFNAVSNVTSSPYRVEVVYGPDMPIIMGPNVAKTGDNITLRCHASSHPPSNYTWYFGSVLVANTSKYVSPPLTTNMTGNYTCMAYNYLTGFKRTALKMLTVVDPIQHVQVNVLNNSAIEGSQYMLMCIVVGPADHIYWMMNGQPLHGDNTTVFVMSNTVSFIPLEQSNTGNYQCMAVNAVGNMTSPPYALLVNYGPETPIIEATELAETGQPAFFNCSVMSVPPSQISWWFNNTLMANTSMFMIGYLSLNMSGEYMCMAYNNVTGMNSSSWIMLTVIAGITSVMVRNYTVPVNSNNFTLICDVTGPYDTISWIKDNYTLNTNTSANNMSYHTISNMLYFTPVTMYNNGNYQCVASNQAAQHKSPTYNLQVNYGPLNVSIAGPNSVPLGSIVTLFCSAISWPKCAFNWIITGSSSTVMITTASTITFLPMEVGVLNYTCLAYNPVTNITMLTTKVITVDDYSSAIHLSSHGGLVLMCAFALSLSVLFN